MEEIHRAAIQKNFVSLVEQTDLDVMVSALYEKGVFSEQMIEPYKDTNKDTRSRKRLLYADITRRGPRAFNHLVDALSETGCWNLVRDLDPNSSLHTRQSQRSVASDESNFLSISTEKKKTKLGEGTSKSDTNILVDSQNGESTTQSVKETELPELIEIPQWNVVKSRQFTEPQGNDIKLYATRGSARGCFVMFSYFEFSHNIEKYRTGVLEDVKNLKYLFKEIGLRVLTYQNLNKEQTESTLKSLKNIITPDMECLFIMVSSHGYARPRSSDIDVRCSDGGLVSFYDIVDYFNNENFPELRGKPKVFILQLCRGSNDQPASGGETDITVYNEGDRSVHQHLLPPNHTSQRDRIYSDILIAHSTVPGFVSHRDPKKGSWYIQSLCKVFAERAHELHVEELFKLVDENMARDYHVQTSSVDSWGFNKRLFLNPGLAQETIAVAHAPLMQNGVHSGVTTG